MKQARRWQTLRGFLGRAQHSGGPAAGEASASGRPPDAGQARPTPTWTQGGLQRARYGPQAQYRLPWREGVFLLTGGAIGWALSRSSSANIDLAGLDWEKLRVYFAGTAPAWPFAASPGLGPNFLADAAAKAAPAVVSISVNHGGTAQAPGNSCGSGFITDASGVILTNAHVVEAALAQRRGLRSGSYAARRGSGESGAPPLLVSLQDGRTFPGMVLSVDSASDLALLKVDAPAPLPAAALGSSGGMRVGEWVLALGSPLTLANSVTAGIVSCTGRKARELGLAAPTVDFIQTDAAVSAGSSGGPLVNMRGEVVGVSCARALGAAGVSFAIPIDEARGVMRQLQGAGRVARPFVGIAMLQLTPANAALMQQRDAAFPPLSEGILVPRVTPGSPAAAAGLRQGDIITGFGSSSAETEEVSTAALVAALAASIGRPLPLAVARGRQRLALSITPVEARDTAWQH